MVDKIADQCSEQGVPMVFALSRRRMAYVLKKKHNVGCIGIFSYDGAETQVIVSLKCVLKFIKSVYDKALCRDYQMEVEYQSIYNDNFSIPAIDYNLELESEVIYNHQKE